MQAKWIRYRRWCVGLSQGGVLLGVLQGLGMVNFAQLITDLLSQWLSILVALLLGVDPSTILP